jgi:hypothetical protein
MYSVTIQILWWQNNNRYEEMFSYLRVMCNKNNDLSIYVTLTCSSSWCGVLSVFFTIRTILQAKLSLSLTSIQDLLLHDKAYTWMRQLAWKPQLPSPQPNVPGVASPHLPAPFYALLADGAALPPSSTTRFLNLPQLHGWCPHFITLR